MEKEHRECRLLWIESLFPGSRGHQSQRVNMQQSGASGRGGGQRTWWLSGDNGYEHFQAKKNDLENPNR